jgi:hypothetical protein
MPFLRNFELLILFIFYHNIVLMGLNKKIYA